jgi:hypothetical protein
MTLPIKATNARRILDLLRGTTRRTYGSIVTACSDIAKPYIERILQEQIEAGHIAQKVSGYRITQLAIDKYQAEESAAKEVYRDNFKPLDRSRFINVRGNRVGSNDLSRDVVKSRQN